MAVVKVKRKSPVGKPIPDGCSLKAVLRLGWTIIPFTPGRAQLSWRVLVCFATSNPSPDMDQSRTMLALVVMALLCRISMAVDDESSKVLTTPAAATGKSQTVLFLSNRMNALVNA
ncbi:hypothetical protein CDAR_430031 [Caerostris darwini]|uniref:Uncharacterized protein n=1 Tax=Caerostris darwini TaxID=1538125 RepID=A0AAV4WGR4_9ARAC|nr:hypothetical protein CDAR_430031 [Caerostris darwini]